MKRYRDLTLMKLEALMGHVGCENVEQIKKWGIQEVTAFEWLAYLTEEVGELAQAINEYEYRDGTASVVFKEAIQVATLSLKIAEIYNSAIRISKEVSDEE
jgi:NTP pyrophosphatase (non-canonical NTP hydrolase)